MKIEEKTNETSDSILKILSDKNANEIPIAKLMQTEGFAG